MIQYILSLADANGTPVERTIEAIDNIIIERFMINANTGMIVQRCLWLKLKRESESEMKYLLLYTHYFRLTNKYISIREFSHIIKEILYFDRASCFIICS